LDIAAVTDAWMAMLQAPPRSAPGAWSAEQEPALQGLEGQALEIEVSSDQRRGLFRGEAALLVDRLLTPVARGSGALEVAIGEALGALSVSDRTLQLGYVSIGDYARERLGLGARKAQAMAQLSRELGQTPLLREAVLRGEVSPSKARVVLQVAYGAGEAAWVERARNQTVRSLERAVREERGEPEAEEAWERICLPLSDAERAEVDEALRLAGKAAGTMPARALRLEALAQEYLSEHPDPGDEAEPAAEGAGLGAEQGGGEWRPGAGAAGDRGRGRGGAAGERDGGEARGEATGGDGAFGGWSPPRGRGFLSWPLEDWPEVTKEALEAETRCWEALGVMEPLAAPRAGEEADPHVLDRELRRLMAMHRRWDHLLGHLGLVMKSFGLWRELRFASFDHYCLERLWLSPRAVEQRVWLERRCYHLPGLGEALRSGRLSYEQARLVAGEATPEALEEWIRKAEGMTCIALRRAIDGEEERQMSARGTLELPVPVRVSEVLDAAFRSARKEAGRWLSPGECLLALARHFKQVWAAAVKERSTPEKRARRRDEYCQVPGCSRLASHGHHVIPVSQGGTDDPWNIVGVCVAHHLHCIHRGWVRLSGRAPDQLVWELG
ncbi:MAG TPA: HNH endonuclease signature motif containing protein, partial [Anaeromyxobacteraceae bacterium]|nr:HNH endonuclease signature motif containing protein [Anaeromyxobacteraceae bacterium]